MQTRYTRPAAWLITLLLLVTLVAVIAWTAASEPVTLALPTPAAVARATASPTATVGAAVSETATAMPDIGAVEQVATATEPATATPTFAPTATAVSTPTSTLTSTPEPTATTEESTATATLAETAATEPTSTEAATATVTPEATDAPATLTVPAAVTPTSSPTSVATSTPTVTTLPTTPSTPAAASARASATPTETILAVSGIISTVQIIELPAPTPTPGLPAGEWGSLTDPNQMSDLAVISNTIWIASGGGALAWSKGSTTPVLYTAADGLAGNQLNTVANCALPNFGVVFGGPTGLQVGEARTGRWRQMDSSNSDMRYDDVATLYCDAENDFFIVGYATHGIDIYDVADDEWRHMDRNSGLAANDVRRIAVIGDREQIWVASDEGVTVSAGEDSTFYDTGNSPLTDSRVGAMAADADEAMWLGGEGALYRVQDEEWTVYAADEVGGDFPTELITGLAFAPDGSLWLGSSDAEICRFDVEQERCAEFFVDEESMAAGPLTNLAVDSAGRVYYVTAGNGYAVYEDGAWRSFAVRDPKLVGNRVKALAVDVDGVLWAATEAGVQQLVASGSPRLLDVASGAPSPLGVRTLLGGAEGGIWVGGQQGASFFNGEEWQSFTAETGLAGDTVQAITIDGEGRTWFGGDRGLSIWNGSSFFVIDASQGLPSEDIRALAADPDGVWIGTAGGGLYRFEGNQLQLFNSRNVGLPSDNITALAAGSDGVLWIGSDSGLAQFADGVVTAVETLGDEEINALAVTDSGDVWAAPASGGVWFGSGDRWTRLSVGDGLPSAQVTAIVTNGEQVWLGGQDGGISLFQY